MNRRAARGSDDADLFSDAPRFSLEVSASSHFLLDDLHDFNEFRSLRYHQDAERKRLIGEVTNLEGRVSRLTEAIASGASSVPELVAQLQDAAAAAVLIASLATQLRSFVERVRFREPVNIEVRGIELAVTGIDTHATFEVQWMTQIAQLDASQGMYDYLRQVVIFGPGQYKFDFTIDTVTWGTEVSLDDVPPHVLIPLPERTLPKPVQVLDIAMLRNRPQSDPKDAPELEPLIEAQERQLVRGGAHLLEFVLDARLEHLEGIFRQHDVQASRLRSGSFMCPHSPRKVPVTSLNYCRSDTLLNARISSSSSDRSCSTVAN
jgi:hypothetical protein